MSGCSSEESVDLCEVTVEADSDGEEQVLLPAGTAVRDLTNQSVSEAAFGRYIRLHYSFPKLCISSKERTHYSALPKGEEST